MEDIFLLVWIVILDCSSILPVASYNVSRVANFRVFHQHPGIRNCAADILKQDGLVGGRVSNVTGVCEGLQQSWDLNQTMQNGYSYFKTIHAKQKYHPPVKVKKFPTAPGWLIPGVLHAGAEIQVTILTSWLQSYPGFSVNLINLVDMRTNSRVTDDGVHWDMHAFSFWTKHESYTSEHVFGVIEKDPNITYYEESKKEEYVRLGHSEDKKRKFTIQALTDGFKCLFGGKVALTYQRENFDPKIMKQVYVQYLEEVQGDPVAVHSFEFREHVEG